MVKYRPDATASAWLQTCAHARSTMLVWSLPLLFMGEWTSLIHVRQQGHPVVRQEQLWHSTLTSRSKGLNGS